MKTLRLSLLLALAGLGAACSTLKPTAAAPVTGPAVTASTTSTTLATTSTDTAPARHSWLAPVKPWERGTLADYTMRPGRDPLTNSIAEHVYFTREAFAGGRGVGGGGCGCN